MKEVMRRWVLVLAVVVASATVTADSRPAPAPAESPAETTSRAESAARAAEQHVTQLTVHRITLARRYQDELEQIDRLKNQRATWRRDRELRDSLSDSLETANQLSAATRELERARGRLESARRSYLAAIDTELSSGPTADRARQLTQVKAQLEPPRDGMLSTGPPQLRDAPRRIVIPDFDVDPLADPEELEQRAAELRASEEDLGRQLVGLKSQAAELDRVVMLRKQHERAGDLFNRDNDEPHRNPGRSSGDLTVDETSAGIGGRQPSIPPAPPPPNFENFVPIVLADVIDASTINSLAAAQRSGDPAQRAEAAHRAGEAVAKRLAEIRRHRLDIEERARALRHAKG